ncbi:MAG TPA: hypothetical protein VLW54_07160 [Candidatus Acidoferrales bacterium]|nr:hypothetical protein [Candidatus Acidoferrales bacterium]
MRLLDFLHSPAELMLVLLFASSLALGACLWLVWHEMRRAVKREERLLREAETYLHQQIAGLNEKLAGEMARRRQEAEQVERSLETAVRRRLDELSALIESLRLLEAKLGTQAAPPAAAPAAAEPPAGTVAKEVRGGLSVIGRPPKS